MSEEMRDDFAAWRGLLRQPDALPGHGLTDREAAWDKLFERLSKRPRRLLFSYRVAAACLLILLIPAARFFQERPARGLGHPLAQPVVPVARQVVPLAVAPASRPQQKPQDPVTATAGTQGRIAGTQGRAAGRLTLAPVGRSQRNPGHPAKSPVLLYPELPQATGRDTASPKLAATESPGFRPLQKPKKQWKVIDLNELDPHSQHQHPMATSRNSRPPGLTINLSTENR